MLTRVLEPEWMDSPGDAAAYDRMDHRQVNDLFVSDLLAEWENSTAPRSTSTVLDLGCGTGLIPIALCHKSPFARITAVDASEAMLTIAARHVRDHGLQGRIMLLRQDVNSEEISSSQYDVVCCNSLVHHLHHPAAAFRAALKYCHIQGLVFFRDLLRPASGAETDNLVAKYGGSEAVGAKLLRDSLKASLTLREVGELVDQAGGDRNAVIQTSDRHWTWAQLR